MVDRLGMDKKLSVVIVNFNTKDLLNNCLNSLKKTLLNLKIIVVDNASTDGSADLIKKEFKEIRLIESRENIGFSAANNLATGEIDTPYVLFLNPDTIVPSNTLEPLLEFMEKEQKTGALTCKVELADGSFDKDCHRGFPTPWASLTFFLGASRIFSRSKIFNRYHLGFLNLNTIHEIDSCAGSFMLVRREAGEEIDWWDKNFFFYGEDLDFCYRLKEKGWKIMYYPQVKITHLKGASSGLRKESKDVTTASKETKRRVALASIEAMKIFYQKHYSKKYPNFLNNLVMLAVNVKGYWRVWNAGR